MPPRFQRARSAAEKEQRRDAILRAAVKLARSQGPLAVSLNEVGRTSGVSKPNIYRYFESREAILLALLVDECEALVAEVEAALPGPTPIPVVAERLAAGYLARPLVCQLLGMLASILEHNLSADAIADAKRVMLGQIDRAVAALRRASPWLDADGAAWVVRSSLLFVAALWPAAHPSPSAAEVLDRPEFAPLRTDAPAELRRYFEVCLRGLQASG